MKDIERELMNSVGRIWFAMKRFGRRKISEMDTGLTFDQMLVLFTLEKDEGLMIGALAEKTDRDRTTTSRMVSGLEKKSLVLRVPDRDDNRQKLIYLTRSAKELMDSLEPVRREFAQFVYGGIRKEDIEKAVETLGQMADNLERE